MHTIDHASRGHCELSPSSSKRWMACPGSIRMSRGAERVTTIHAAEGTAAHELGERCITLGTKASDYVGTEIHGFTVSDEMAEAVQVYVDHCNEIKDISERWWVEQQISLASLNPPANMWGTADFVAVGSPSYVGRTLYVSDLKFGKGVVVETEGNTQLLYYGLGAYVTSTYRKEISRVEVSIIQPRAPHVGGPVRSVTYTVDDLVDFAGEILQAADRAMAEDAPLVAGPHCRWCPAEANCPAQMKAMQELARIEFANPLRRAPEPHQLTEEQLRTVLARKNEITSWLASVEQYSLNRLKGGSPIDGFKLVETRPRRVWAKDEQEIAAELRRRKVLVRDMYARGLKSPRQIEIATGLDLDNLTIKFSSGVTIAPATDPRPAALVSAASEFNQQPLEGDA